MRLAAAIAAAALVLVTAAPAEAHTTLTWSDPAKGATVSAPPAQIRLTYADPVRFPGVVVTDAKGGHHESGKPQAVDNHVVQPIQGVLPSGVYTVGWRVVAEDGHPVTGEYKFTVKNSEAPTAPASAPPAQPSAGGAHGAHGAHEAHPGAQPAAHTSSAGWWWIGLAILVVALIGGGAAYTRRRGAQPAEPPAPEGPEDSGGS